MEIERKYLVARLPDGLAQCRRIDMEQAYLCTSPTVRVRRENDRRVLTVKERNNTGSENGMPIVNREEEFELSEEAYNRLRAKCEGLSVEKCRYIVPLGESGLHAELDLFKGRLEGLQMVEVEFPGLMASLAFTPPDWFGKEVTSDPRYRNSFLSTARWDGNEPVAMS